MRRRRQENAKLKERKAAEQTTDILAEGRQRPQGRHRDDARRLRRCNRFFRKGAGTTAGLPPFSRHDLVYSNRNRKGRAMLGWALTFFVIAVIAAILGFGGIAAGAANIAQILFFVFAVLFVIAMIARAIRGRPPV
ncbi:MAG: DUF1328 domain-containing protein [Parvularculaceae bacterium]